jgi:hypothetical protein
MFYIMKFHNFSHELGMIHKFNNTQGNKISFKYPIMNKVLYNQFIVLLTSRLLQTNNLPLKFGVNHIEPTLYKSLRFKEKSHSQYTICLKPIEDMCN